MTLTVTLSILAVAVAATGWANWRQRRPRVPGDVPLAPYTLIQFVGVLVVILMLGHLITLLTGKPFTGRFG